MNTTQHRVPIVTVTMNPAIDLTVRCQSLQAGAVNRAQAARIDAGGKGINVASVLADWGVATAATGLLGRTNASVFEALFDRKQIEDRCLRISGETRTNIKIVDGDGCTTDLNLPGLAANPGDLRVVADTLDDLCREGGYAVLAGSLPSGLADDSYLPLLRAVAARGARAVLDTSGAPLAAALGAPRELLPYAIKPNRHELEAWAGEPLVRTDDLIRAARRLQALGVSLVVVSQGEHGALFVDQHRVLHAGISAVAAISSVGAGDAMVAGLTSALLDGADLEGIARRATAFAAAKLGLPGPHLPDRHAVQRLAADVLVTRLA